LDIHGEQTAGRLPVYGLPRARSAISFEVLLTEREVAAYLALSTTINEFTKRIRGLLNPLGIHSFWHTNLKSIVDVLDVFGIYPTELTRQYAKEEFYRDDLILRHLMVSDKPIFDSHVYQYLDLAPIGGGLLERNLQILKLKRQHGLRQVFSIPIVNADQRAVFSVSTRGYDQETFESAILRNICSLLTLAKAVNTVGHQKFSNRFHGDKVKIYIPVSVRSLQLLEVLAKKELSLKEAATVLGISISTANQLIASAKNAFGVRSAMGAVVAAIRAGYIVLDP
jgi:DNA-binding CsgD family transcriptional regulator